MFRLNLSLSSSNTGAVILGLVSLHCSFVLFLSLTLLTQSQSLSRRIEPFNPRVQVIHSIFHKDTHPCAPYPLIYLPLLLKAQQGNGCVLCLFPFACVILVLLLFPFYPVFYLGMSLQETLNDLHDQNGKRRSILRDNYCLRFHNYSSYSTNV